MENTLLHRKRSNRTKESFGDMVFLVIAYGILLLFAFCYLYPLYFTVIASVSDAYNVYRGEVFLLPKGFTLEAYTLVFQNKEIWTGYANTIYYTVMGTCLNLILTIPTAYALSRKRMFGRPILMYLFLFTMYFSGGMIPTYLLYKNMDLINTRWVLILHGGISVYNVIVTRTYFQNNIPEDLFEAARIDGASEFGIFFKIVLQLSAPILAVITLYYAVSHWSAYFSAMIYTSDVAIQPLQVVLRRILILNQSAFVDAIESGDPELIADAERRAHMALTMKYSLVFIASAPMLIAYPFVQKHFVKGMMVGSVKG